MNRHKAYLLVALTALAVCIYAIQYHTLREDFTQLILLFAGAWLAFGLVYSLVKYTGMVKWAIVAGLFIRLLLIPGTPNLSDDYHRYVWDGIVSSKGLNPYEHKPSELVVEHVYDKGLYDQLNSPEYYTVYPPLSQAVFKWSYQLSDQHAGKSVLIMKFFILLFEAGSIWLLLKLLKHYNRPRESILWYALNPFVIIELIGNLHFEAGMIFFCLLAIWLALRRLPLLSALALMGSVGVKLWPILFVPFFLKRLPTWRSRILFSIGMLSGLALLFIPFWGNKGLQNMQESLNLYVQYFEFNASIYYLFRWLSLNIISYETYSAIAIYIPLLALPAIGLLWLLLKQWHRYLPRAMLLTLFLYLLFATTVHPWYVAPLVAFAVLTRWRFAMVWSVLIPLTYLAYSRTVTEESFVVTAIYVLVLGYLFLEVSGWGLKLIQRQYIKRARIKMQQVGPFLPTSGRVLDLGCGNGAFSLLLQEQGLQVESVDVANRSVFPQVHPHVYNGRELHYADNSYDVVLVLTVLHHTPTPDVVLQEAMRVGKKVVVMEDVYNSRAQLWLTWLADSLANMEFWGHPHTNRTDEQWRQTFETLGWQVTRSTTFRFLVFFQQVVYKLEKVG